MDKAQRNMWKVLIAFVLGWGLTFFISSVVEFLTEKDNPISQQREATYLQEALRIGMPKNASLTKYKMDRQIGGARVLINEFDCTTSEGNAEQYFLDQAKKYNWMIKRNNEGQVFLEKDNLEMIMIIYENKVFNAIYEK